MTTPVRKLRELMRDLLFAKYGEKFMMFMDERHIGTFWNEPSDEENALLEKLTEFSEIKRN